MPKEITHIMLADEACRVLANSSSARAKNNGSLVELLQENITAYRFGSVATDIFFYDIPLPLEKKSYPRGASWGNAIHGTRGENTMALLFAMVDILQLPHLQKVLGFAEGMPPRYQRLCQAFAMGYLTHIALDTVLHPIVYYYSGNYYAPEPMAKKWSETRHRTIESLLDLLVLEQLNQKFNQLNTPLLIKLLAKEQKIVLGFFTLALRLAYGQQELPAIPTHQWFEPPENIYLDPLYYTVKRASLKQRLFNRLFRSKIFAKIILSLNRKNSDKFSEISSLVYPTHTYAAYLKTWHSPLDLRQLNHFQNPLTSNKRTINFTTLSKRCLSRCRRYLLAFDKLMKNPQQRTAIKKILNGPSLNNGRCGTPVQAMQFFAPLPLNGNFELVLHR